MSAYRDEAVAPEKLQGRIWTRPWMRRLGAVLLVIAAPAASIAAAMLVHAGIVIFYVGLTAFLGPLVLMPDSGKVTTRRVVAWVWWPVAIPLIFASRSVRWIGTGEWR